MRLDRGPARRCHPGRQGCRADWVSSTAQRRFRSNGRIDLLADYNAIPDTNTPERAAVPLYLHWPGYSREWERDTELFRSIPARNELSAARLALNSTVFIQGLAIHDESNSILFAPGAAVSSDSTKPTLAVDGQILSAGVTFDAGVWHPTGGGAQLLDNFVLSSGQIYLDSDASIDVSGSQDVSASVSENIVAAQLLGPELANSPLQRNGPLRGQTVFIDITQHGTFNGQSWVGSPIGELSGYVNLVQHTVGELTANGGTVNLNAGNSVVMQAGSNINVSGGTINYQGSSVQTSEVIDTSGHVYDISQATPDRVYTGIVNGFADVHTKWGVVNSFQNPLQTGGRFQAGYVQGGNGGSLAITAPSMALDGNLSGTTVRGPSNDRRCRRPPLCRLRSEAGASLPRRFYSPRFHRHRLTSHFRLRRIFLQRPLSLDGSGNPLPLSTARQQNVVCHRDYWRQIFSAA